MLLIPSEKWFDIIFGGVNAKKYCPKCGGISTKKHGFFKGKQRYRCKYCGVVFILRKDWVEQAYKDYALRHLDIAEIALKYGKSASCVWKRFDSFKDRSDFKILSDKNINLIIDTTYFGRGSGYMIFRANGRNIYFDWTEQETVAAMAKCLSVLDNWNYTYKSFTIDGRKGFIEYLKMRYPNTPIQFCQFHQKQIIKRCITNKPQTLCGQELKAIMTDFCQHDYDTFNFIYTKLRERWDSFLKEKNDKAQYKHRMLRRAFFSLKRHMPYLFTYKGYEHFKIPNTTNSCDGYFRHLKAKINRHCGLSKKRKAKLISFILKNF